MWSIHNFPAYNLFVGCVTKGQVSYPPCGATTESWSLKKLKKMVYYGTCGYLPQNHPYKRAKMAFDGKTKIRVAPIWMSSITTIVREEASNPLNRTRGKLDPWHKHGIKQLMHHVWASILEGKCNEPITFW